MPFHHGFVHFRLDHQAQPTWPTVVLSYEEAKRQLHKLQRTACGCMKFANCNARPKARVLMLNGITYEFNVARLMVTLSADRPLGPTDYACHQCDDHRCANPDHLYIGTHRTNAQDKFRSGRPIRERMAARWFDYDPNWISQQTDTPTAVFEEPKSRTVALSLVSYLIRDELSQAFLDP